ncbi:MULTISPECIES: biotin-dependent carboxyltransferase family protein [Mesorhizobium]|uniref:5-oxoprolinase subunit C family protein n=2 Tax=Phyllobacteriaceae TaxID=69277 RepID=UPI000FCAC52E|nr:MULTISPECIES: biotin-dependent carboxyltransferase family protein [Mesorhizobium]RVB45894.1 biotin-dependent carboxyltransferase family protein [Mesorhizobium sp. M7A.F.Ca.CA.004.05.1.1]MCF6121779.1 biotin-dependent carboxyltransferase family protein [Mesorhizobium ciceri]MCQ8812360.1 biotin-dependent carboxyltransferase family protein [Mesorhizobium sp. SEMIA396]RUX71801.1 biotin-dependent carboxyltransferase family protein [Mesorhizobium sp. M7A.F.Ca.CA.004.08.2.1]RUX82904.1 biotin-depend
MIEILTTGLPNTVQDLGRPGHLALGVSHGGAMDKQALAIANLMLGNDPSAAGIEVTLHPFRLRAHIDTAVAITGADCAVSIGDRPCPPWWAMTIRAGETLVLEAPRAGARSYIAFAGGIDLPPVMGSRATDVKGGFGGFAGRGLSRGDRLALKPAQCRLPAGGIGAALEERRGAADALASAIELRVLPAAEFDAFTPEAQAAFTGSEWRITDDANRMGYRLAGETLSLLSPLELLSHGIVPGTVQVPPSGQPIIQLADANTCGGYPKIATVIEADLWRLAQAPVGARLRFSAVSIKASTEALRANRQQSHDFIAARNLMAGEQRTP